MKDIVDRLLFLVEDRMWTLLAEWVGDILFA